MKKNLLICIGLFLTVTSFGQIKSQIKSSLFKIGQNYGGGVIFYLDTTHQHGLIAALNDLPGLYKWGCDTTIPGANQRGVGAGKINTQNMVAGCGKESCIAAFTCMTLNINGYTGWYIPDTDELNLMYLQRAVVPGTSYVMNTVSNYWSSFQSTFVYHNGPLLEAWAQSFGAGNQFSTYKREWYKVRPIRAF
jgi:hypothetical protein